jgi:hypothetical protein
MKNVAATSGQRVSFAFLFVEVTARAGNWAGRDKVLNFLSRPPSAILALSQPHAWSEFASCRIRIFNFDARKICKESKIFFAAQFGTVTDVPPCDAALVHRWWIVVLPLESRITT